MNQKFFIMRLLFQGKRVTNNRAKGIAEGRPSAIDNETEYNLTSSMRYSGKRRTIEELVEGAQNAPKMSVNFQVPFHKELSEPAISGIYFQFNILSYLDTLVFY